MPPGDGFRWGFMSKKSVVILMLCVNLVLSDPALAGSYLSDKHVVFVGGYLGESIDGYFQDNAREALEKLGAAEVSVLQPHSGSGFHANAAWLEGKFRAMRAATGRALVVVGHSKGGAETALLA